MGWVHRWMFVVGLLGVSGPAWAQTVGATSGAIQGRVLDTSDAVLPGVSVTVSGSTQIGTRTVVTDADGIYRLPGLTPGTYRVAYELGGFATTVRESVVVPLGFTVALDVALGVATLEQAIVVTGASPVVDAAATRIQTNYDAERLASIPNARDIWAVMAATPAVRQAVVDVGGASAGSQSQFVTYGTRAQNQPMIEGMLMSQIGSAGGSVTFYYDYGSFQEVSVNAAGNAADMAMPGVQFQFVSKSGGNEFHGRGLMNYQHEDIQSTNIDADLLASGVSSPEDNRLYRFYDRNADIGGPLKRDRIWWYTSVRDQKSQASYANFPERPFETQLTNLTGKGTWQLSANDKVVVYGQAGKKLQPYRQDTGTIGGPGGSRTFAFFESADSTAKQDYIGWVWKGEYDRVLGANAFAEIRGGRVGYTWKTENYTDETRREDIGTLLVTGGNTRWREDVARNQVLGTVSYFKNGWAGAHTFKAGFEVYRDTQERDQIGYPGNVLQNFNNLAPIEVRLYQPSSSINRLMAGGAYITDSWQVGQRLTLSLGARVDRYRSYLPAQSRPASPFAAAADFPAVDDVKTWVLPAPRFGATYKLTAAGTTVLKVNAGRFWWNPDVNVAGSVNPNIATAYERYAWTDSNGDWTWQRGEEGRLIARVGGAALTLDPDLENTYTDELAAWVDHELMPHFQLRTGLVWRGQRQLRQTLNVAQPYAAFSVPVPVRDPGPDGRAGTADDGDVFTLRNLEPAFVGQVRNLVANTDTKNDYYTWEITGTRRMHDGWSLMGTYAITWNRENLASPGAAANPVRSADAPNNPNDIVNASDDGRYHYALWNAKLHAVVPLPWRFQFAPLVRAQAGQPFGRTFVTTLNYGSQRVLAEPIGTRRQDHVVIADARLERIFALPRAARLSAQLDVYNLTNANPVDFLTWGSGASFLRPTSVVPPRIVRVGVTLDW